MLTEQKNQQRHLNHKQRINLGSYYTNIQYVDIVWNMIEPHINLKTVILDSSCGYGNFFKEYRLYKQIGADIDPQAIKVAKQKADLNYYVSNALYQVNRKKYEIKTNDSLCIIGNPPYNDRTSIIRKSIKNKKVACDADIFTRDLGMSFLLSYQKLSADVICVLHPLSYLIKKANFNLLTKFMKQYQLIDSKVISSGVFSQTSKSMEFPILIALYKKSKQGTTYKNILNFNFKVADVPNFKLVANFKLINFDNISHYVQKYPNKQQPKKNDILFWTLRDINALKRNQTFIKKYSSNAIIINKSKLEYYIYIDVFKHFSKHIPYYFGNCDVLIDNQLFKKYKKYFILDALNRHKQLRQHFIEFDFSKTKAKAIKYTQSKIAEYFKKLLGTHYLY